MTEMDRRRLLKIAGGFESAEGIDVQELRERLLEEEWQEYIPKLLGLIIDPEHPHYGRIGQIQIATHDFFVSGRHREGAQRPANEGERKLGFVINIDSVLTAAPKEAMFIFDKSLSASLNIQVKDKERGEGVLIEYKARETKDSRGIYIAKFGDEIVEKEDWLILQDPPWEFSLTSEQVEKLKEKTKGWRTTINSMVHIPHWSNLPIEDACLTSNGIPVWAVATSFRLNDGDIEKTAKEYSIASEEVKAAVVYFKENIQEFKLKAPDLDYSSIEKFDPYNGKVIVPEWTKGNPLNAELADSRVSVWVLIKRLATLIKENEDIYKVCSEQEISEDDLHQAIEFYKHHRVKFNEWENLGDDFGIPNDLLKPSKQP